MDLQNKSFKTALKDIITEAQDVMAELRKNIQMYNEHKNKISSAYKMKMERLKSNLNLVTSFSQNLFVCSYSLLFMKLIIFNHYRKFNLLTKFSLLTFYCLTIEPMTLASCKYLLLYCFSY